MVIRDLKTRIRYWWQGFNQREKDNLIWSGVGVVLIAGLVVFGLAC